MYRLLCGAVVLAGRHWLASATTSDAEDDGACLLQSRAPSAARTLQVPASSSALEAQPFPRIFVSDTKVEKPSLGPLLPSNASLINLGWGKEWKGWGTKVSVVLKEFPKLPASELDQVVVVMDTDACFGGCTDLMARYNKVREASGGAPVIVSGNAVLWPNLREGDDRVELYSRQAARWPDIMKTVDLKTDAYPIESKRAGETRYRFVNAGFVMGPAREVLEAYKCIEKEGAPKSAKEVFDDQRGLMHCAATRPELITIDYTGSVILSTHKVAPSVLEFAGGVVNNTVTGLPQCFVHTPGLHVDTTWAAFGKQCKGDLL